MEKFVDFERPETRSNELIKFEITLIITTLEQIINYDNDNKCYNDNNNIATDMN